MTVVTTLNIHFIDLQNPGVLGNVGQGYESGIPTADGTGPKLLIGSYKTLCGLELNYKSSSFTSLNGQFSHSYPISLSM